jgi:hypothetical protein
MHNDIGIAGGNSSYNSFGAGCEYNILGNNSSYNTFGNSCSHNMIGQNCCNNSWGNSVSYTGFVNERDVIPSSLTSCVNYCYNNRFDDGVSYIYLLSMSTASYTRLLMNYHIHRGCSFSQSNPLWLDSTRGSIKTTHVYKGSNPDTIIL